MSTSHNLTYFTTSTISIFICHFIRNCTLAYFCSCEVSRSLLTDEMISVFQATIPKSINIKLVTVSIYVLDDPWFLSKEFGCCRTKNTHWPFPQGSQANCNNPNLETGERQRTHKQNNNEQKKSLSTSKISISSHHIYTVQTCRWFCL